MTVRELTACHDCGVKPGEMHIKGCDVERCAICGSQWISCGHDDSAIEKKPWEGEWPGAAECRNYGWYCYWDEVKEKYFRCSSDHPDASEDINRYVDWCEGRSYEEQCTPHVK